MLTILTRNWWALALRGLWALVFGLLTLFLPGITLMALVWLFGAYAIVDGIFTMIAAIRTADRQTRWWMLLIEGLVSIAAGTLVFVWPNITILVLVAFVAAWVILTGAIRIIAAIRLRREIEGEWTLILSGALALVFGLLLAIFPAAGVLALMRLMGAFVVIVGVLILVLAFRLRSLQRHLNTAGSMR